MNDFENQFQLPRKIQPELLSIFLQKTIKDGFRLYFEQPLPIIFVSFLTIIPTWLVPMEYIRKFNILAENFDWDKLGDLIGDVLIYSFLSLLIALIARAVVLYWVNQARLSQPFEFRVLLAGFSRFPRVVIGYFIVLLAFVLLFTVAAPFFLLTLIKKELFFLSLFVTTLLLMFFIIRWQPKFEYMIAGLAITDEPVNILWKEWRYLPQWIWLRFLILLGFQFLVEIVLLLLTTPLLFTDSFAIGESLQIFIMSIGMNICIGMFGIAFVRSRDEWAEMTNPLEIKHTENEIKDREDWTD